MSCAVPPSSKDGISNFIISRRQFRLGIYLVEPPLFFSFANRKAYIHKHIHLKKSAINWCSDLHGAANTQQLRRQNFCSRWTSLVELSSCTAAQSRYHLRTVQTTAEGTPFSGSMNTALCDFWYAAPWKNTYLLTYLLTYNKRNRHSRETQLLQCKIAFVMFM